MNVRLYVWQRLSAVAMLPLLLVHIAIIFYATKQDLTAADVLSRTRGSISWALFYGLFVVLAAIHAGIGIRNILVEWSPIGSKTAGRLATAFALLLSALGFRAIVIMVLP